MVSGVGPSFAFSTVCGLCHIGPSWTATCRDRQKHDVST
jgi:hypothetical protein